MVITQKKQAVQANKFRWEPDFGVNNKVWLSMEGLSTSRPSRKLDHQRRGPYKITVQKGYAFKLDLPPEMRIHNNFAPDRFRLAADDPLPGQRPPVTEPVEIHSKNKWEVNEIVASRLYYKKLQYQAKWNNADDNPTWYPASNFIGCPHLVQEYHQQYPDKPGPPRRLGAWLEAYNGEKEFEITREDELLV
ncbi:chromo domain-containing protein [Aspergillus affinis]|uniref:chromo domain-containing protein n=1 Tax=Aspergillus affinis TaxID=1070780 RepID=UPI0022FE632F|nr:uncharacterized protein KD926_003223 [Aspergillus affinis]KAI9035594.1 hypothetical protein KD926_003223 [Aspergillus affinis]